jgi:Spy/CpxP family protein refolding chaperone
VKKIKFTLMVIVAGLFLVTHAYAWGGHDTGKGFRPCKGAALEKLKLTDDQKAKIEALQEDFFKASKAVREKIFDKSVELRRLWLTANPDKNKIEAVQKELRNLRDQMEDKMTAMRLEINNALTPDQKEKLAYSGWGRGHGFGPRGAMRHPNEFGRGCGEGNCPGQEADIGPSLGMCMCQ